MEQDSSVREHGSEIDTCKVGLFFKEEYVRLPHDAITDIPNKMEDKMGKIDPSKLTREEKQKMIRMLFDRHSTVYNRLAEL